MTHLEHLARRLRDITSGREEHADQFALTAELQPHRRWTRVYWSDTYTGQAGELGKLATGEVETVVPALFGQLREWRKRCEQLPEKAKAVALEAPGGQPEPEAQAASLQRKGAAA